MGQVAFNMKSKTLLTIFIILIGLILFILINKLLAAFLLVSFLIIYNLSFILLLIGGIYYNKDDNHKAGKYFKNAYNLWNSSLQAKMSYANFLLGQAYIEEAEKVLKEIISKKLMKVDEIKAKALFSIILWKTNRLDEAIEMLTLLHEESKNSLLYQNLGYFLILKGDYSKSLEYNLDAYEYNNTDIGIIDNLALNYYFIGNISKAKELYETIIPMNPRFASAYYNYTIALLSENRVREALESLNKALNCKFSFISIIKKEEIEAKITQITAMKGF